MPRPSWWSTDGVVLLQQTVSTDAAHQDYTRERIAHWDGVAHASAFQPNTWSATYHARLIEVYRSLVPAGQRVLEIGCGEGDLLAALQPSFGVGVDFSGGMIRRAAARHP